MPPGSAKMANTNSSTAGSISHHQPVAQDASPSPAAGDRYRQMAQVAIKPRRSVSPQGAKPQCQGGRSW